ncbi:biotin transporter BioY [Methanomicrobiaceae archaeon CYW5]|uniref:biotin transporter BioY n=1 Tax=Methanovulcanius yangii TaxID=1789227 RepID=UPI0029CA7B4C|nr:biotin transporter BioY [Methanovulcanius yangii]MBT8507816.1 biotin transporter BioY [Methanovulcanius yangii]
MYGNEQKSQLIALTATFVALITVGAWISVPLPPVPLTLTTFFVLLAGVIMKRYAAIPAALYLVLGALNIPVFHNGLAGIGVILGPTGGFIVGFIPAALIVGLAYEKKDRTLRIMGIFVATVLIYAFGVAWLSFSTGIALAEAILLGVVPFLIGDALKGVAVYYIGERIE